MTRRPEWLRLNSGAHCHACGIAPARIRLGYKNICGVCWNRIGWLRWAQGVLEDSRRSKEVAIASPRPSMHQTGKEGS